jgi:hypothetical protein
VTGAGRLRKAGPWLALVAGLALVALVTGTGGADGAPLDPRSTSPDGAKGLVMLLEEMGADVDLVGRPGAEHDHAVVLAHNGVAEADLRDWVRQGGTLLVADPGSPLFGGLPADDVDGPPQRVAPSCREPAFAEIDEIEVTLAVGLQVPAGSTGCFPVGRSHLVVVGAEGRGAVVSMGGPVPLLNATLDEGDNAALATAVLAPRRGSRVAFVSRLPGSGQRGLLSLIGSPARAAGLQLLVAFAAVVVWRARRLGRPVAEREPVQVAGSEMVMAVGRLLHRGRRRERAARELRGGVLRLAADRLGTTEDPGAVAPAVAARLGLDATEVTRTLTRPVADDAALTALAAEIEHLRQEIIHAP